MLRAFGDGKLFGEPYGDGPYSVVWLHGWARRGADFAAAAKELEREGFSSVALDLPGFGSSPPPEEMCGARGYAAALVPILHEISNEPVVLVGHSFGGRIATALAAEHPEMVRAIVLTGVPLLRGAGSKRSPVRYRLVRWLHDRSLVSDARMEAARQRHGSADYRRAQGVMRDVLVVTVNESYEDELSRIRVPVLMLWGQDDRDIPSEGATRAMSLLTSAHTMRLIEGVGHMLPVEAPHELAVSVRQALS